MTLPTLLARALVSKWNCASWFRGAELRANLLLIDGDAAHVMFVEHMWLDQFKVVIPDLIVRQKLAEVVLEKPAARPSIFKKGYVPGPTRDLFDS